jgi:CRP/FNR family transcriptional regulator, dissimilatory nitrate respiration regulator
VEQEKLAQLLLGSEFGQSVGKEVCLELLSHAKAKHYPPDTIVFQEQEEARNLFIVARGMVKLTRISWDGRESVLAFVEPPHLFAEAAIFLGKYPATAITLADSDLLLVDAQTVLDMVRRHESFLRFLFGMISQWLQRLVTRIDQLTLNDGSARVARYLLSLSPATGDNSQRDIEITLPTKKGDLADLLNMNQPSLSRILRRLQDNGFITVQARTIQLHDLEALRKLTMPPLE